MKELTVTSTAFQNNQSIPEKYSCEGPNPPLSIEDIPEDSKSLALILDDPDAPGRTFDHWIVWNIAPSQNKIVEHTTPGIEGFNSHREHAYIGPCPPPGKPHHYVFKVFALDIMLDLGANSSKKDLENAMKGHVLAEGKLVGLFSR
jgi:Raf kinase inhibitor-like YbhB/YbcL family protein